MSQYLKFITKNGDTFFVQVENVAMGAVARRGEEEVSLRDNVSKKISDLAETVEETFEDALTIVKTNGTAFSRMIKSFEREHRPDEMQLKFNLSATGEAGTPFIIAKAGIAAGYSITLTWRNNIDSLTGQTDDISISNE